MTTDRDGADDFANLEESLTQATQMAAIFDAELQRMRISMETTNASVGSLSSSVSRGLRKAFDGLVLDGMKLSDAMQTVSMSIINATYSAAIKPVTDQLGGIIANGLASFGAVGFANGGAFSQGRVMPFAKGGVVTGPTTFPMRGALA